MFDIFRDVVQIISPYVVNYIAVRDKLEEDGVFTMVSPPPLRWGDAATQIGQLMRCVTAVVLLREWDTNEKCRLLARVAYDFDLEFYEQRADDTIEKIDKHTLLPVIGFNAELVDVAD